MPYNKHRASLRALNPFLRISLLERSLCQFWVVLLVRHAFWVFAGRFARFRLRSSFEEELRRRKAQRGQNSNEGQKQSANNQQQDQGNSSHDDGQQKGRKSYWQKKRETDEEAQ